MKPYVFIIQVYNMKNEHLLILELCKFLEPNKDKINKLMDKPLDYPHILGHLLYNRMGATAYHVLKECELLGRVNREFRNTLKAIYDSDCEKNESFNQVLNKLLKILRFVDFPYVLLKGA